MGEKKDMITRGTLGKTDIEISNIGISSSFGAEQAVYHEAYERGCNYFTWGTFIKGRSAPFKSFVHQMTAAGKRQELVIGLLSYSHTRILGDMFLRLAIKQLGCEYIDGLILGYFSKRPPQRILDWAQEAREKGLIRAIGLTTHNRKMVAPLAAEGILDYFHIRYNAVHRGAEKDIFGKTGASGIGLVSFTATSWRHLLQQKKMPPGRKPPSAGDCYRFVLARKEIDCCMMGVRNLAMLRENLEEIERKGVMSDAELADMAAVGAHIYGR